MECHAYDFCESPLLQQRSVAAEHSLIVDGRVESRRRANRVATRRSRQFGRSSEDISPLFRPHAGQRIPRRTAAERRRHIIPIPRLLLTAVQRETESIARLGDDTVDDGLVPVRERPPIRSDTA